MRWMAWIVVGLVACEPMPSSGQVFQPVQVTPVTPAPVAAVEIDVEPLVPGEEPAEDPPARSEVDPLTLQARLAGVPEAALTAVAPAPAAPVVRGFRWRS